MNALDNHPNWITYDDGHRDPRGRIRIAGGRDGRGGFPLRWLVIPLGIILGILIMLLGLSFIPVGEDENGKSQKLVNLPLVSAAPPDSPSSDGPLSTLRFSGDNSPRMLSINTPDLPWKRADLDVDIPNCNDAKE